MFLADAAARKNIVSLLLVTALFSALVAYILAAMRANERSAEEMAGWVDLVDRVNEGKLNVVKAGDLVAQVYYLLEDVDHLEAEVGLLEQEFSSLAHGLSDFSAMRGKEQFSRFVDHGGRFYQELKRLLQLKRKMMENCVYLDGAIRPIHEVIQERQLVHYKFVNQLAEKIRKGDRFLEGSEFSRCKFLPWVDDKTQTVSPVLDKMLRAVEPLHRQLHETAAMADQLVGEGRGLEAKRVMDDAFAVMRLLDGRLTDIAEYADDRYQQALKGFLAQKEKTMGLHGEILEIVFGWKGYLKNSVLPESKEEMRSAFATSRLLIVAAAIVAIALALVICLVSARKTVAAFRLAQESNEAIKDSLEKQRQLINELEGEIERRKKVEADLQAANQELEDMAVTDGLTGLYNHRFMKQFLHMEHSRAIRHQHELSVIMLDIDFFKKVNDRYGHGCGDVVLLGIAEILQQRLRSTDMIARFDVDQAVVARYGGEEMAVILPETPLEGAAGLAEDLRRMIESYTFHCEDVKINITVSIGVASSSKEHDETWSALLGRADAALYRAKNGGRNRVEKFSVANG